MNLLILLAISSAIAISTEGCSCFGPVHPQEAVCIASVLIRGKVLGRTPIYFGQSDADDNSLEENIYPYPEWLRYELKVEDVYVDDGKINAHQEPFYLYTAGDSATCGLALIKGEEYLISAWRNTDGRVTSNSCSFVENWNRIAPTVRHNFETNAYAKACRECKVDACPYGCRIREKKCRWNPMYYADQACLDEAVCIKQKSGECEWNLPQCNEQGEEVDTDNDTIDFGTEP